MHTYYEVKEMLYNELEQIVKKGELSAGSLDTVDKLLNSIKNSCKIIMYEEYADDGYSYADANSDMSDYSNARSRAGGRRYSRARNRDGRGRYSRTGYSYADDKDEKMEILHEMKENAQTDEERRVVDKLIRRMERE